MFLRKIDVWIFEIGRKLLDLAGAILVYVSKYSYIVKTVLMFKIDSNLRLVLITKLMTTDKKGFFISWLVVVILIKQY
jgi:hypothetical protein